MFASLNTLVNVGIRAVYSSFLYSFTSMRQSHMNNSPTPDTVMQGNIIMLTPKCLTVGVTHSGLYSFPIRLPTWYSKDLQNAELRFTMSTLYVSQLMFVGFEIILIKRNILDEHVSSDNKTFDQLSLVQWQCTVHLYVNILF